MRLDVRNTVTARRKANAAAWRVVAVLLTLCLALVCRPAYAADNETEMTGDFVPVELGSVESEVEESPQSDVVEPVLSQGSGEAEVLPLADGSTMLSDEESGEADTDANISNGTETPPDAVAANGVDKAAPRSEAEQANAESQPSDADRGAPIAAIVFAIVAVALAVVGIVLWRLRKRRQEDAVPTRPPTHLAG